MNGSKYFNFIIFAFVVLAAIAFIISRCVSKVPDNDDIAHIRENGALRVVIDSSTDGMQITADGDTVGEQFELIREFCRQQNLPVEYKLESNLNNAIEDLQDGECDVIVRYIPVTSSLRDTLLFTESLIHDKQVLVQRKKVIDKVVNDSFVHNQLELAEKTVTLAEESPSIIRINNLSKEIGDTIYINTIPNYDNEAIAIMVSKGEFQYTVLGLHAATRLQKEYKNLDIHLSIGFSQLHSWAVRKTSVELCDSLNSFIKKSNIDK
jgi:membrane-bound lytic murein transglycosylase MltF